MVHHGNIYLHTKTKKNVKNKNVTKCSDSRSAAGKQGRDDSAVPYMSSHIRYVGEIVYWAVWRYYPYLVSLLFVNLLSQHLGSV